MSPLTARHAAAYARLLTTLCSPTMSSAAGAPVHGSQLRLKDDMKQARTYVGQYIPQVLATYCQALLRGRLSSEVKDALMPGLWAALETVEPDALKAMSSGMDEASRDIWVDLYSEWRRAGGRRS